MIASDVRCLRCGTLLISGDGLEQIRDKIADEKLSMTECILDCPKCRSRFGLVMACDQTGIVILLVPPEKTERCFVELKQVLEDGLSIANLSTIVNNAKKPQYISFLGK